MGWTGIERNLVAETYRELWPGDVTDLEMAMFCKALGFYKTQHVLDGMYHIFSNQDKRLRPAAGRVREMACEAMKADPEEIALAGSHTKPREPVCTPAEIRELTKEFWDNVEKIPELPEGIDD